MATKSRTYPITFRGEKTRADPNFSVVTSYLNTKTVGEGRTGYANPTWKRMIVSYVNAATSLSAYRSSVSEYTPLNGKIHYWAKGPLISPWPHLYRYEHTGFIPGWNVPEVYDSQAGNTAALSKADQKAIRFLHKKIRAAQHQFQGGVFIGELKKTIQLLLSPGKALSNGLSSYVKQSRKIWKIKSRPPTNRANKRNNKSVMNEIAGRYLEATFGWQPLLNDVKDAALALARHLNKAEMQRFRAIGSDEVALAVEAFTTPMSVAELNYYYQVSSLKTGKAEVVYYGLFRGAADVNGSYSPLQSIVQLSGFDLASFAPTVWELIPFSFVVDYFTNIGDVIEATTNNTALVSWLVKVEIQSIRKKQTLRPLTEYTLSRIPIESGGIINPSVHSFRVEAVQAGWTSEHRVVTRTPITDAVVPPLKLSLELPNNLQWLNVGALVAGGSLRFR